MVSKIYNQIITFIISFKVMIPKTQKALSKIAKNKVNWIQITESQYKNMFQIVKSLGQGSYGLVFLAKTYEGNCVALKQYKEPNSNYSANQQALTMSMFFHENILKIFGTFKIKESLKLILVTQYCSKSSLKDFILNITTASQLQKTKICLQISKGLQQMHKKNIMHRDLKPQNILINQKLTMKICDFGFGKFQILNKANSQDVGTPLYRDPNIQKGNYTKKCDVYSLGLIIFYIFKGEHLFESTGSNYQLKDSQKKYFTNKSQFLYKSNLPEQISQVVQATVTQNQCERLTSQELRVRLQRFKQKLTINQNNIQIQNQQNQNVITDNFMRQFSLILAESSRVDKQIKQKEIKIKYLNLLHNLKGSIIHVKYIQKSSVFDQYQKTIASFIILVKYSITVLKNLMLLKKQILQCNQSKDYFVKLISSFQIQIKRCRFPIKKFCNQIKSFKTLMKQKITQNLAIFINNIKNIQEGNYQIEIKYLDEAYDNLLKNCKKVREKQDYQNLLSVYKKIQV